MRPRPDPGRVEREPECVWLRSRCRPDHAPIFLDARYQLVQALRAGSSDPVPQLFTEAWDRLSPLLKQAIPGVTQQTASQYTSFIGAMGGECFQWPRPAPRPLSNHTRRIKWRRSIAWGRRRRSTGVHPGCRPRSADLARFRRLLARFPTVAIIGAKRAAAASR